MGKILRVLLCGDSRETGLEQHYQSAFERLGVAADRLALAPEGVRDGGHASLVRRAIQRLTARPPSLGILCKRMPIGKEPYDIAIVFKGYWLRPDVLTELRVAGIANHWVCLNPDSPFDRTFAGTTHSRITSSVSLYDGYVTWTDALGDRLRSAGAKRVLILPFGWSRDLHTPPTACDPSLESSVVFVGSWDRCRERTLVEAYHPQLKIFGHGWQRVGLKSPLRPLIEPVNLYGNELRSVVASAAGCVNLLRPQNSTSHNMRTFEVPAMGGMQLLPRTRDHQGWFPEGRASLMFSGAAALRKCIRLSLSGQARLRSIRTEGERRVAGHSYDDRAETLLRWLAGSM